MTDVERNYPSDKPIELKNEVTADYIMIGNTKVPIEDVIGAWGGSLTSGLMARPKYQFGNSSPLGLCGFALTTFVLSLINAGTRNVSVPNIVVGLAFFYGGAAQLIAGVWELVSNNTFAATALCSYGAFWMSYAAILTPSFGIANAYANAEPGMMANAIGFYLAGWTIFTAGLCTCTMKSTIAMFLLFFMLFITFLLLTIAEFSGSTGVKTAGGVFGVITALVAWFDAFAGVATPQNSYITVRPIYLPGGSPPKIAK